MSYWQEENLRSYNKKRMAEGHPEITPGTSATDVLNLFREVLVDHLDCGLPRTA